MAGGPYDNTLTRVQPFFESLLRRDPSGRSWLPGLLAAAPHGRSRLGELVDQPGWLIIPIAVPAASGRLACFEYPAIPPRELLAWFIDHPDELVWPPDADLSAETVRLRRALLLDDPRGSQARAQERARELLATRSLVGREWWRFEAVSRLDCVLITDRLVLTIVGKRTEPLTATTEWYPQRSQLVRDLEAAKGLSEGKQWATLLLSEEPLEQGSRAELERTLPESAPHLSDAERAELLEAYLGNLTWREARQAVSSAGLDPSSESVRASGR
jgi:hypothetical protein